MFEDKLARLEGAEAARGFASGMAAISGAVLSQVQSGDRMVCVRHVYPDAYRFFEVLLPRMAYASTTSTAAKLDAMARALVGARVLYLESPSSWVFEVQDIARLSARRARGRTTIVDNSWASRSSSGRWRTASISCCTRLPNISAATATRWPAWSPARPS